MFGKPFCHLVSNCVIVEDETRVIVQGYQIRPAIVAILVIVTIAITTMAPSANPLRLFTSLDVNLE
jgi:hypothetical protein